MPDFGEAAAYIWASYAIVSGGALALSLFQWVRLKKARRMLEALQDEETKHSAN